MFIVPPLMGTGEIVVKGTISSYGKSLADADSWASAIIMISFGKICDKLTDQHSVPVMLLAPEIVLRLNQFSPNPTFL